MVNNKRILILGCGYLGTSILRLAVAQGYACDTLSRNPETCKKLLQQGAHSAVASYLDSNDWHSEFLPQNYNAVIVCVGSSESTEEGYQKSYIKGLESVIRWIKPCPQKLIYTSSISVYGGENGQWVKETDPPSPMGWRGELILKSENILRQNNPDKTFIVRLGGTYGKDRNNFLKSNGRRNPYALIEDYYLNLIHVEDASSAILKLVVSDPAHQIYNLTDGNPSKRSEIDQRSEEARKRRGLDSTEPPTRSKRRSPANRRIDSSLLKNDLDWNPRFGSVLNAIDQMV